MDYSKLSDDQLVELVRSLCYEAARRGWAVQQAAQAAMLGEAEKARIAAEAAVREAERLREAEAARIAEEAAAKVRREAEAARSQAERDERLRKERRIAALCEAVFAVVGEHCTISLWSPKEAPDTDRRVYFDEGDGFKRRGWKFCVYLDGNRKVRPGTVEGCDGAMAEALSALAELIVRQWVGGKFATRVYFNRSDLQRGGEYVAQYEPILAAYRAAVAEEEAAAEAERQARQTEVERKAQEKAAANARFAEKVTAELAPIRQLMAEHGCEVMRLSASTLGGRNVLILVDPHKIEIESDGYSLKPQTIRLKSKELEALFIEALKPLLPVLRQVVVEQPPIIKLTPLEVAHA
jgi:hypothetical protein